MSKYYLFIEYIGNEIKKKIYLKAFVLNFDFRLYWDLGN